MRVIAWWLFVISLGCLAGAVWLTVFGSVNQADIAQSSSQKEDKEEPVFQLNISYPKKATVDVPILMYHYIRDYTVESDPIGTQLSVSPDTFAIQLKTIRDAGYKTISLTDFIDGRYGDKPIILTFDDGYASHYTEALPLLKQYDFTGTFFITTNFLGRPGYMTKSQVLDLVASGMEVGGHTLTHRNLANTPYEKAVEEISGSLKSRDNVFAYPSGKYSPETLDILDALNVKAAVTTNFGLATENSDPLQLPRIRVKEKTDILKVIAEEKDRLKKAAETSQP